MESTIIGPDRDGRERPDTTFEDLPKRLGYCLRRCGLSFEELAMLISTSPRSVESWVQNRSKPSAPVMVTIVQALRVLENLGETLNPDAAHSWLFSDSAAFGGRQPAEIMEAGSYGAVEAVIVGWRESAGH